MCPLPGGLLVLFPREGGQAGSRALPFGNGFGINNVPSSSAFQAQLFECPGRVSLLQECHREKKLAQVAGRCSQWETASSLQTHLSA